MKIYLIRHGETEYNRTRKLQGYAEIPLNDAGIAQAARLGQRFADVHLDQIYASDLRRTVMTAAILAARNGAPIEYREGLRERDPGELTHKSFEEGYRFFLDPTYHPPGGESQPDFEDRVAKFITALIEQDGTNGRHIALVTHGMFCRAFVKLYLGDSIAEDEANHWPNTCVSIADYDGAWTAHSLADASHLEGLEDSEPDPGTGG